MKKILALMLALVMALSLCACGADPAENSDKTPATSSGSTNGSTGNDGEASGPSDSPSEETGYVGTWKVVPPDDNFPPLYMVLNEDGTAGWGAKLDNLSPRFWYECDEADAKENQMELAREDNMGYGNDFYLTEDGKIYMDINMTVGDNSYDHIYFERQ